MSLPIQIVKPTRRVRCHVPGCRNRDAYKITRRNDVNGNPLYLCEECMKDIKVFLEDGAKHEKSTKKKKTDGNEQSELESAVFTSARTKIAENQTAFENNTEIKK
jgi:hypothetical protein